MRRVISEREDLRAHNAVLMAENQRLHEQIKTMRKNLHEEKEEKRTLEAKINSLKETLGVS